MHASPRRQRLPLLLCSKEACRRANRRGSTPDLHARCIRTGGRQSTRQNKAGRSVRHAAQRCSAHCAQPTLDGGVHGLQHGRQVLRLLAHNGCIGEHHKGAPVLLQGSNKKGGLMRNSGFNAPTQKVGSMRARHAPAPAHTPSAWQPPHRLAAPRLRDVLQAEQQAADHEHLGHQALASTGGGAVHLQAAGECRRCRWRWQAMASWNLAVQELTTRQAGLRRPRPLSPACSKQQEQGTGCLHSPDCCTARVVRETGEGELGKHRSTA